MMRFFIPLLLICLADPAECAPESGDYLVIGSFEMQSQAIAEGERLSGAAGVEVLMLPIEVGGRPYYRLLVHLFSDEYDQARLKSQLRYAGVGDMWRTSISGKEPGLRSMFAVIDYAVTDPASVSVLPPVESPADSKNFLVAGSFQDISQAQSLRNKLEKPFDLILIKTATVNGADYHRVLVGPVEESTEQEFKARAMQAGVIDGWMLRDVPYQAAIPQGALAEIAGHDAEASGQAEVAARTKAPVRTNDKASETPLYPKTRKSLPGESPPGGYNPAKLREKPSPFFLRKNHQGSENRGRWRTDFGGEYRVFSQPGINDLDKNHGSISIQSEFYKTWNNAHDIFAFVPFARWDDQDKERTHVDIRELTWVHVADSWELRTGIRKVFWGVTESQHLVDIVNQTDNLENPDGEEKLGQAMINLSLLRDWGVLDFYLLTGFRERDYPGIRGRPRLPFLVDEDAAIFESSARRGRTDFAVRWVQTLGELELGLSHFSGTTREPRFNLQFVVDPLGTPVSAVFIPIYEVIEQTGIDAQYFVGDWAWKLEAISRGGQLERFTAITFGFEKTFVGAFGSRGDLGVITEYLYDDRGESAPVIGEDDVALGVRYAFNNVSDTTALLVGVYDLDSHEFLATLEASSRIGANWKIIVEASLFSNGRNVDKNFAGFLETLADSETELAFFQDEDFLKIELIRYF